MAMTSPPYWGLRDYGVAGQLGLEPSLEGYMTRLLAVFDDLKRVLKPTGSAYVVLGDTYCAPGKWGGATRQSLTASRDRAYPTGMRPHQVVREQGWVRRKQLALVPSRFAIAMQERGWILRNDIIWHKTNGLPASVKDRLSNRYEHLFHFVKSERYYYNLEAIREPYKASSIERFGGLLAQGFGKQDSKYRRHAIPAGVQCSDGETPVPLWLREIAEQNTDRGYPLKKLQRLYLASGGMKGHGHYAGGEFRGIESSPFGKNPGDMWSIAASSYRGAHFAVYPEKLCIKPILSSSPPWVCKRCGVPKREVVTAGAPAALNIRVRDAQKGILHGKWGDRFTASDSEVHEYHESVYHVKRRERVIAAGCDCDAGLEPGVVLDPFVGSGTTMKVALELGRSAMGIELNPDYVALVRQRILQLGDEDIVHFDGSSVKRVPVPPSTPGLAEIR